MPSQTMPIRAPIGGWNALVAKAAMPETDAVRLDNWVVDPLGVMVRNGWISHVTGIPDDVQTLMTHSAPSGTNKMFAAAADNKIYDVTSAGAVGASVLDTLGNGVFQQTMFATSGGNYLVICNGATDVRNYSGSAWSTPTINNVTSANLIAVASHVGRLFFVEKSTLKVWYLAAAAISGDATALDLGVVFKRGGSLLAIGSWTRDGGSGPDDLFYAITDQGEVAIYSGTDPDSASTWGLQGVFPIPHAVGRRCALPIGGDVAIITAQGVIALSTLLPLPSSGVEAAAITNKVSGAFRSAYAANSGTFGWQASEYPKGALFVVNVPTGSGITSEQFVMNTLTKAWSRFTDLDALCWGRMGDDIYFGTSDGLVKKYGVDFVDGEDAITAVMVPAFSNFGTPAIKRFLTALPIYTAAEGSDPPLTLRVDYDDSLVSLATTTIPEGGTVWDSDDATWDEAEWGPAIVPISNVQSIAGVGRTGSLLLSVATKTPLILNQVDVTFEVGSAI